MKRKLSFLLVLSLLVSMMPSAVFGATFVNNHAYNYDAEDNYVQELEVWFDVSANNYPVYLQGSADFSQLTSNVALPANTQAFIILHASLTNGKWAAFDLSALDWSGNAAAATTAASYIETAGINGLQFDRSFFGNFGLIFRPLSENTGEIIVYSANASDFSFMGNLTGQLNYIPVDFYCYIEDGFVFNAGGFNIFSATETPEATPTPTPTPKSAPTWTVSVDNGMVSADIPAVGKLNNKDALHFTVNNALVGNALKKMDEEIKDLGDNVSSAVASILVNTDDTPSSVSIKIDKTALNKIQNTGASLIVSTKLCDFLLSGETTAALYEQVNNAISFSAVPFTKVPQGIKDTFGPRPVMEFVFKDNRGREIESDASVTYALAYTPAEGESIDGFGIAQIVDDEIQWVENAVYEDGIFVWDGAVNGIYGVGAR